MCPLTDITTHLPTCQRGRVKETNSPRMIRRRNHLLSIVLLQKEQNFQYLNQIGTDRNKQIAKLNTFLNTVVEVCGSRPDCWRIVQLLGFELKCKYKISTNNIRIGGEGFQSDTQHALYRDIGNILYI